MRNAIAGSLSQSSRQTTSPTCLALRVVVSIAILGGCSGAGPQAAAARPDVASDAGGLSAPPSSAPGPVSPRGTAGDSGSNAGADPGTDAGADTGEDAAPAPDAPPGDPSADAAASSCAVANGKLPDGSPLPTATSTGPLSGTVLTPFDASGGMRITVAGTVVQDLDITGWIEVAAPDVTIKNCKSTGVGATGGSWLTVDSTATNTVIESSEFDGSQTDQFPIEVRAPTTITGSYFHDITGNAAMMVGGSLTFTGNYVERVGWNASGLTGNPLLTPGLFCGCAHVEALYFESGSFATVTGNNFNTPIYETVDGIQYLMSTATFFSDPFSAGDVLGPITISNNLIAGSGEPLPNAGGLLFYLAGQGGYTIAGNAFGPLLAGAGYIYSGYVGSAWAWAGNTDDGCHAIPIPTGLPVAGTP